MKAIKFLRVAVVMMGILLSACAPAANSSAPLHVGGDKVQPDVIFTGAIESINGNQWVVNGQTITVDQSVLRDGPFAVGDTVKVEASVAADGSITAQRVETPSATDAVEMSTSAPEDPMSTPDVSSTPESGATPQPPVFDDKGNEAVGAVDAITDTSITIGGQIYNFAPNVEMKGDIVAGATVKLHFTTNADGTLSVTEIEIADPAQIDNNQGEDQSGDTSVSDDNGTDMTSSNNQGGTSGSDDGGNHDSNDDHGGGSNSGGGGDNSGGNSGSGG